MTSLLQSATGRSRIIHVMQVISGAQRSSRPSTVTCPSRRPRGLLSSTYVGLQNYQSQVAESWKYGLSDAVGLLGMN